MSLLLRSQTSKMRIKRLLHHLMRTLRYKYVLEKRRIRLCFPRPSREQIEKKRKSDAYEDRRVRLAWRYILTLLATLIVASQLHGLYRGEFINPLDIVGDFVGFLAVVFLAVFVVVGFSGVLKTIFHLIAGLKLSATSTKSRNMIYLITLAYFFLESNSATDDAIGLIPVNALRNTEDFELVIFFFLCVTWLSYFVSRLFDAQEASRTEMGSLDDAFPYFVSYAITVLVAFVVNSVLPLVLTAALVSGLSIDPGAALSEMGCLMYEKIRSANLFVVRDIIAELEGEIAITCSGVVQ